MRRLTTRFQALLLLTCCLMAHVAQAQNIKVTAEVDPPVIAPNQLANFSIIIENAQVVNVPMPTFTAPLVQAAQMSTSREIQIVNGMTSIVTRFQWPITATEEGTFTIPAQTVAIGSQNFQTEPVTVEVKAGAQGMKPDGVADGQDNGLGEMEPILQLHMAKTEFYQGEIVPITATLYIPRSDRMQLRRIGLIEVEKSDLAIQRFPQQSEQSLETLGRMRYIALTFRSSLSGLKPGKVKVGPAKMELVLDVAAAGNRNFPFGFMQMEQRKVTVNAGEIPINVLALPGEGKPAGFSGAVGDFTISASLNESEVRVGDPLAVDVMIEGQGNFDAVEAPKLSPPTGWKVYPPKRYNVDTGDPNTADLINRKLGFNQILVPEKVAVEVPPFEFSFFSPRTKQYVTLRSQPLPVTILPSANPVATADTVAGTSTPAAAANPGTPPPEADITDILMPVASTPRWAVATVPLLSDPRYLIANAVLAALFLGWVGWSLWLRAAQNRTVSAKQLMRQRLAEVEQSGLSEKEFYRRAAAYVKLAAGNDLSPEALSILERYETVNFTPGRPEAAVPAEERARVLGILRQLKTVSGAPPALPSSAVAVLLAMLMLAGSAQAAPQDLYAAAAQALEKGDYAAAEKAASALVAEGQVGPELFTLLGHANYKQGKPGLAAMWYERARLFPASAPELKQNLRHIGEKIHCFGRERNEWAESLGLRLSRNAWVLIGTAGAWLVVSGLGLLIVTRQKSIWLAAAVIPSGLLLGGLAVLGWQARPSQEDLRSLAFVVAPKTPAHTAATKVSGTVIAVPQGSVVQKLEERGKWAYVVIPQPGEDLRGWLPLHELEAFWPFDPAKLP